MSIKKSSNEVATPPALDKVARSEVILAYISLGLAAIAMVYLGISGLVAHEACYGVSASHIQCQAIDQGAAARILVVLSYLIPLYVGAALAMRWQTRAQDAFAHNTAFGLMATCVVLLLSLIFAAETGAGFFLLPSAVALLIAAILGTLVWARGLRGLRGLRA